MLNLYFNYLAKFTVAIQKIFKVVPTKACDWESCLNLKNFIEYCNQRFFFMLN